MFFEVLTRVRMESLEEIMSAQVAQKSVKNRLAVNLRFPGEG